MNIEEIYLDITKNQDYPLLFHYLELTGSNNVLSQTIYSKLHNGNLLIGAYYKPFSKILTLPRT